MVFVICIVIGLFAVQGYGINIDENTEIDIARMDLKEYVRLFFGESSRLYQFMDSLIGNLMDSVESLCIICICTYGFLLVCWRFIRQESF